MKNVEEPFEELIIPRKEIQSSAAMIYRVYKDYVNFELVEAVSALDALAQSKIKDVYKIERHNPMDSNVIQLNQVMGNPFTEDKIEENPLSESKQSSDELSPPVAKQAEPDTVSDAAVSETTEETPLEEPAPEVAAAIKEEAPAADSEEAEPAPLNNDDIDRLLNN